jgi:hypothetical protein
LLQGSCQDAKVMPTTFSGEPRWLEGIRLVLVAPTLELNAGRRKALVASLTDGAVAASIPNLEAGRLREGRAEREAGARVGGAMSWSCATHELERRIEAALLTHHRTDVAA